jgi:transcriptional regulator with XRE-family HTH domain
MPYPQEVDPSQLRARREELGLSQAELAASLGVTANTVARWERAEVAIGNAALVGIALRHLRRRPHDRGHSGPARQGRAAVHHNVPVELSSFIGRAKEVAEVRKSLVEAPLVTLVGAGGVGKTRLA